MQHLQWDWFGVPWLGTIVITVVVLVALYALSSAYRQTRAQLKGQAPKTPTAPPTPQEAAATVCLHQDIHSPMRNGRREVLDRVAPLFYEELDGKWKMSLGRVAFWTTQISFLGMCMVATYSLRHEQQVDGNLVTLYISVITMLFLTNLGLLGYCLGSKFTVPMSKFIAGWGNRGVAPTVSTPKPVQTPPADDEMPSEAAPDPNKPPWGTA